VRKEWKSSVQGEIHYSRLGVWEGWLRGEGVGGARGGKKDKQVMQRERALEIVTMASCSKFIHVSWLRKKGGGKPELTNIPSDYKVDSKNQQTAGETGFENENNPQEGGGGPTNNEAKRTADIWSPYITLNNDI